MKTKGLHAQSSTELKVALQDALADGFAPTLAIVFSSVAQNIEEVSASLAAAGLDVFGATTAGEILAAEADDTVFTQSVVALLLDLDKAAYRLRLVDGHEHSMFAAAEEVGRWARTTFADPALLVMASGVWTDGEEVVRGIERGAGRALPAYGGKAGDDWQVKDTFVFSNEGLSTQGVLALCLDQTRISMTGLAASGWQPVGAERVVTGSHGHVVETIDGVPALQLYEEYLGLTDHTEITFFEWPLQVIREDYTVLRAPMLPAPQPGSLFFGGAVREGSRVRFSTSPGVEIIDEALEEMRKLREQVPNAEALVLFSCACRHMALGPMAEDEIRPMQQLWNVPMVGLYVYGEIGVNDLGRCDFHNETCVLVALAEQGER